MPSSVSMRYKIKYIFLVLLLFLIFPQKVDAQVVINEFQISPDQWIELYNKGESDIDISGWIIDDNGGTEKYNISDSTILKSKKCISFQSGKFNWSQSDDTVKLLNSTSELQEEYSYTTGPASDISIGRVVDGDGDLIVLTTQTKDNYNSTGESCLAPTPSPSPSPTPTNSPTTAPTQAPTSAPTASPTIKPTPTKTPTSKPTVTPTQSSEPEETGNPDNPDNLTIPQLGNSTSTPIGMVAGATTTNKSPTLAIVLITLGVGFLGYGGYLLYNQMHAENKKTS